MVAPIKYTGPLHTAVRGFAKKKNSKNMRLLWKWVGGSRSHWDGKSSQNSPTPELIFWSTVYHDFLSVGYFDLVSTTKKFGWGGCVGSALSICVIFGILFNFAKPLNCLWFLVRQCMVHGSR